MISIITPNFNGERYLRECLNSVANQTLAQDQIEMIIADDGSTDNSLNIIETYASKIQNLKLIKCAHIGKPSAMRNIALKNAHGEYVLFLDSDDYLGIDALRRLDQFSRRTNADVIAFQLKGLNRKVPHSMLTKTIDNADLVDSGIYKTIGIWKMCRRNFIAKKQIKFREDLGRGDDCVFFTEALLRAAKLSILSNYDFMYIRGRKEGDSITQKTWPIQSRILVMEESVKIIQKFASDKNIANHFFVRIFNFDMVEIIKDPLFNGSIALELHTKFHRYWNDQVKSLALSENVPILERIN